MDVFFIRHKLSSSRKILEDLWAKRMIAIHYQDIPSTSYKDYDEPGRSAMRRFGVVCRGAIVGATYTSIKPAEILVGVVPTGSKIEVTVYGNLIYKTIRLTDVQVIPYRDYPILAAIQPRQGTISRWPLAERYLQAIILKRPILRHVRSLNPSQLEILCYEYMRMNGILSVLTLPIGRTMKGIDIHGLDPDGNNIIAQVSQATKQKEVVRKLKVLKEFQGPNTTLFFFSPQACGLDDPIVTFIAIEEVFSAFNTSDEESIYYKLLSRMLLNR